MWNSGTRTLTATKKRHVPARILCVPVGCTFLDRPWAFVCQVADSCSTRLSSENCLNFKSKVLEERAVLSQGSLVALSSHSSQLWNLAGLRHPSWAVPVTQAVKHQGTVDTIGQGHGRSGRTLCMCICALHCFRMLWFKTVLVPAVHGRMKYLHIMNTNTYVLCSTSSLIHSKHLVLLCICSVLPFWQLREILGRNFWEG